jgi:hypothetical protein
MQKKSNIPKIDRRTSANIEVTRKDLLMLFNAINAPGVDNKAQVNILGYVDEVIDNSPSADPAHDKSLFLRLFPKGWQESSYHERRNMGEIIQCIRAGQSIEEIHAHFEQAWKKWRVKNEEKERNAPEPRNKLSSEWRYWKLRQMERALRGESGREAQRTARREFKQIAREAIAIAAFDSYHAQKMLPDFIVAIQQKGRVSK